jgi:ribonuclease M5
MHIKETIVVEGKHDLARLSGIVEATIVCTDGTHLSTATLRVLEQAYVNEGLIIFSDPDTPGQKLRQRLSEAFPNAKHAYIPQQRAKTNKKIGIEHANAEDIKAALMHVYTVQTTHSDLSMADLMDLGLSGGEDSRQRRHRLAHQLYLSEASTKTFLKQCRNKGLTKAALADMLGTYDV